MVVPKAAAALPSNAFRDAAFVFAIDDFLQTWDDVRMAMLTEFNHDPAAAHFVGDCAGGAGASEGVENEVAGVSCDA